ncbi:hypothetical protein [Mucilaginibacter sp. HD30]
MKKLLLLLTVVVMAGCKKEASNIIYPSGTQFNIKNIALNSLAVSNNGVMVIPENPFTVDELWPNEASDIKFYACHSANGNAYKMPESNMAIISIPPSTSGR